MNAWRALLLVCVALSCLARTADANADVRIEARVTAVTGTSVYIDRGRVDHVEVNDRVYFHRAVGGTVEGVVRSVAKNSARAELPPGSPPIAIGIRAEISIPEERLRPVETPPSPAEPPPPDVPAAQEPPPAAPTAVPAHPPWTHPPESWSEELPLLAPAFGLAPEERERRFDGRVYMRANSTWDQEIENRRYFLGSVGADVRLENPFGQGGELELDGELYQRTASVPDSSDDSDSRALLRRFSYSFGGTSERPSRFQFGRFLQYEFPELGVIDGVEWSRRMDSGSRFGASVGLYPEPFPEMSSDDVQAALFYRHAVDSDGRFTLGAAYQQTLHEGDQDRNLFVGTLDYHPLGKLSLRSSVWVDFYGSEDEIKDKSLELTEAQIQADWRFTQGSGVSAYLSHVRFPELLRHEFASLTPEQIRDNHVERAALSGWHDLSEHVRLNARADGWKDQDDDGIAGEIGAGFRDLLYERGEVSFALSHADGSYSSGPGLRLSANKSFGSCFASLSYAFADFEQKDFTGESEQLSQHALYGSVDFPIGTRWDVSLFGERRFGDEQDSYSAGFLLQLRL